MKSIKIQSKNQNTPRSQNIATQLEGYKKYFINSSNASPRQKLGSILAELCQQIQAKTNVKLKLSQQIKRWLSNNTNSQFNIILSEFKIFLLDTFNTLLKNNKDWQKNQNDGEKIIRIKSQQRIKLRLLKQNQTTAGQLWQTDLQKQQQNKQQTIFELKGLNKLLQRKVLLLSTEFNKIKKNYEAKIEKYKKLLNTSLLNFQMELQKEEQMQNIGQVQYQRYSPERNTSPTRQSIMLIKKYGEPTLNKPSSFKTNNQRLTTQDSQKFVTIPTLPIFQSNKKLGARHSSNKYI